MKLPKIILGASAAIIAVTILTQSAFAWHPSGAIVKKAQNVTSNSSLEDANSAASAVAAKPGDTLKYVIEITNNGAADKNGYNDMAKTVLTDTLPDGIVLADTPATRTITENIGTVKPGQTITKEYLVTVTAQTEGVITNTACFTGDSTVNDNPQQGCDVAVVSVTVPEIATPTTPTSPTPTTPAKTNTPTAMPTELPHTGPAELFGIVSAIGLTTYSMIRYSQSRRDLLNAQLRQ